MGQALYRKYRSKSLKDVIGQEHVTKTLAEAIKQGQISHAYLFTGPRGVGKTSVARILAHEINDLPYTDDTTHIDIIEIDAASNRRIDEIRELRDKVRVAPSMAKYKVYIIDEVHMLTREAFNALLKTLEEPPAHVVFILATTDQQKLPETIISRTQRFHFKPAETADTVKLLEKVAKDEKIAITADGIGLLAKHSDGSFRDALSLLDQARSHSSTVDEQTVEQLLGLPPDKLIKTLLSAVTEGDSSVIVKQLSQLYDQGYQASIIAKQLGQLLRAAIITHSSVDARSQQLELLGKLIDVAPAHDPERYLEIVLLQSATKPVEQTSKPAAQASKPDNDKPPEKVEKTDEPTGKLTNDELWPAVLQSLKRKHNTLYGIVRMAKPNYTSQNSLQLTFNFAFHQSRLNESHNRNLLLQTIEQLTGRQFTIDSVVDKAKPATKTEPDATIEPSGDSLSTINNIFSGAELLES